MFRPEFMFNECYSPNEPPPLPTTASSSNSVGGGGIGAGTSHEVVLGVRILAARHLTRKSGRGMVSPYVEVEICGADYDNAKFKTKTIHDNGFNPMWDEFIDFKIQNPDLALLR